MYTGSYFRVQMEIYVVGSVTSHGGVIFLVENTCHPKGRKVYQLVSIPHPWSVKLPKSNFCFCQ